MQWIFRLNRIFPIISFVMLAGCGSAEQREADYIAQGKEYVQEGNLDKAQVEIKNALQINPKSAAGNYEMGLVLEAKREYQAAAGFYLKALELDSNNEGAHLHFSQMMIRGRLPDEALKHTQILLTKNSSNAEALLVRAAARAMTGQLDDAMIDARQVLVLAPDKHEAVALLASLLMNQKRVPEALAFLYASLEKAPDNTDIRLIIADIHTKQAEHDQALKMLREVILRQPKNQTLRLQVVGYLESLNRSDEAKGLLEEGVRLETAQISSGDKATQSSAARLAMADFLLRKGDKEIAEKTMQDFIAADPKNNDLRFGLGRYYEIKPDLAAARNIYTAIRDEAGKQPTGLRAINQLARVDLAEGKVDEALLKLKSVLDENPKDSQALLMRSEIAVRRNDAVSAIADLRSVLEQSPNVAQNYRLLARAHEVNNEPQLAMENLQKALEIEPDHHTSRLQLVNMALTRRAPSQAQDLLQPYLKLFPDDPSGLKLNFQVLMQQEKYSEAKTVADRIIRLLPDNGEGYFLAGLAAQQLGEDDVSRRHLEMALEKSPDKSMALSVLVRQYLKADQMEKAVATVRQIVAKSPDNAFNHNLLGELFLAKGDTAGAEKSMRKAIEMAPKWWLPYRSLALTQMRQKQYQAAITTLQEGLKASGGNAEMKVTLGQLLEEQGQIDAAIKHYEDWLSAESSAKVAANNLAMLLATHRTDRISLEKARKLMDPLQDSSPVYLDTLGWIQLKLGDADAAIRTLERAVAAQPDAAVFRFHQGMAYEAKGELDKARNALRQALASGVQFEGIDQARVALERVQAKLPAAAPTTLDTDNSGVPIPPAISDGRG